MKVDSAANPFDSKQHFGILDGLRGIAALSVVIFHFMEIAIVDYANNFIAHAFLAVDFFFCLSGFVIAYAYDNRLMRIGTWSFFKLRLIRLHPLVIIGSVIGLLTFIFDPYSSLQQVYGAGQTALMFIASCLMIPYPIVQERSYNLFHLNPPSWSLFFEYVANIFYAFVLVRMRNNKVLWLLVALAAGALFYEAHLSGNLSLGWSGPTFRGGMIRVAYSFMAGMLVYRSGWIIRTRLGFLPVALLLVAAFLMPFVTSINPYTESLIVIFYLPFIVALGAGATLRPGLAKLCKFSGDLSYPLYMTHYPFIWIFLSYWEATKPTMSELMVVIPVSTLLLIGFACLIMYFVDIPVRRYLKNRMEQQTVRDAKA